MTGLYDNDPIPAQYHRQAPCPITAYPYSYAGWFRISIDTENGTVIAFANEGGNDDQSRIIAAPLNSAGSQVVYEVENNSTPRVSAKVGSISTDTDYHVCAVSASSTDHKIYLDAGTPGTDTLEQDFPRSVDSMTTGTLVMNFTANTLTGEVWEVGAWDVALTQEDIAQLAARVHPLLVRPADLISYWPLIGRVDRDWITGGETAGVNANIAPHRRIYRRHGGLFL